MALSGWNESPKVRMDFLEIPKPVGMGGENAG